MLYSLLFGAAVVAASPAAVSRDSSSSDVVSVSQSTPDDAGEPILRPFVSFSIEFSSFPDFAGNLSQPNKFSNQLLDNLADLQGVKSYIRVGGNTQTRDFALYDPNLKTGINGTIVPAVSSDYPAIIYIGSSYFESFATWPGAKFSFGFDMGKNGTEGTDTLLATAPLACKALKDGKLAYWELGNEPDLFKTSTPDTKRPANWTESDYVTEWLSKTQLIKRQMAKACSEELADAKYISPSFAGLTNSLDPVKTWQDGLDKNKNIMINSMHNYIGGATQPGVTLQKTLMNHTSTVNSVQQHVNLSQVLNEEGLTKGIPYILGEMNSLYNEGKPGLSNSFGAALWGVDFNLYCASQSIRRTHMHQGTDYRYAAWQPISTNKTTIGTKAPYYGNVMVAAMLGSGDSPSTAEVQVVNLALQKDTEAAYAAYVDGELSRLAVINMQEYNYTSASASRPTATYSFRLPEAAHKSLSVQRLMANGSDAISGITWDGWSYNYELKGGAPVRLNNVTIGETVSVDSKGVVELEVPWSSGLIVNI